MRTRPLKKHKSSTACVDEVYSDPVTRFLMALYVDMDAWRIRQATEPRQTEPAKQSLNLKPHSLDT